jgi:hypothetical protein
MEIDMKVYIATETAYDGNSDIGRTRISAVFSSEEKVKAYMEDKKSNRWYEYDFEVFEVE